MFDFTGTRFDFTVAEGMSDRVTLRFTKSKTAEKVDLAGSTWQFRAKNAGSGASVAGLAVEHGGDTGELVLLIPVLKAGAYNYELFATDAAGDVNRVFYGVCTAITSEHGAKLVKAAYKEVARTLDVVVPVVNGAKLELRWVSCSVAEAAAAASAKSADDAKQEADRAKREADRVEGAADGVAAELAGLITRADNAVAKVEGMEGRLDAIDNHIRDSVVPNATTNTWWIAGKDTHYPVTGDPGRSPKLDADGFWLAYDDVLREYVNTGINARGEDGRCPIIGSNGNWLHWNQKAQVWEDSGVQALGKNGINGSAVRRIIVAAVADIPTEGETCNGGFYYYVPVAGVTDLYDVYAWLEQEDGTGGWVRVGEASDIATSEIYGIVKTATDVVVHDGAPVGNNEHGQMSVPLAGQATSGSVRISYPDTLTDGGRIGFDEDWRLLGEAATILNYGDVKLSYSGEEMTTEGNYGTIGLRPDGTIGVRWAKLNAPGVVRLGSEFGQLNRIPYQQGVGATPDHQIANNILFKGALQHQKLAGWMNRQMPWLDALDANISSSERKYLNNSDFYTGLYTSAQFEQSEERGLVLVPATTGTLAGVYLATSMNDTRDAAVPTAKTAKAWSLQTHYAKAETYTKEETEARLQTKLDKTEIEAYKQAVNDRCAQHERTVAQTLNTQDNYIRTQLYTKTEFNTAKEVFMTRTENWHGSVVMSENAYNELGGIDSKTMYFLTAEE